MPILKWIHATTPFTLLIFLSVFVYSNDASGQYTPDDEDEGGLFSSIDLLYSSPENIELLALSVVRFEQNASVFVKWKQMAGATQYIVRYKLTGGDEWLTTQSLSNQKIIEGLSLDNDYVVEVFSNGFISDKVSFSTHVQKEPIGVSKVFYMYLAKYFAEDSHNLSFDSFINGLVDVHPYEKLSFQQAFSFENKKFRHSSNINNLNNFYPVERGSDTPIKPFYYANCGCKVVTSGSLSATPSRLDEERFIVVSRDSQYIARGQNNFRRTFVDRFEAGPAKFISLRQYQGGFTNYQLSNIDSTGTLPIATTTMDYILGCLGPGGTFNPALSDRCLCDRPLEFSAQYTSRLHVKAEHQSCIGNKSARAEAEDVAVLWTRERGGPVTPRAAGRISMNQSCNSTVNAEFYVGLAGLLGAILPTAVRNLDTIGSNNLPSTAEVNQFVAALQNIIRTPTVIRTGECGTTPGAATLIDRRDTILLRPNRPIRVGLSSGFHLRTTGTNCYRSEAGIASDYFLMGVVTSRLTEDAECCADKYASYMVGSLSVPPNGDVVIDAVHSVADRLTQVGQELANYGDWDGHQRTPVSNIIDLRGRQFNRLVGRWCQLRTGDGRQLSDNYRSSSTVSSDSRSLRLFPNPSGETVTISWQADYPAIVGLSIFDMQSKLVHEDFSGHTESNEREFKVNVQRWIPGMYVARIVTKNEVQSILFTVN